VYVRLSVPNGRSGVQPGRLSLWKLKVVVLIIAILIAIAIPTIRIRDLGAVEMLAAAAEAAEQAAAAQRSDP
jgi:hypothetical protein